MRYDTNIQNGGCCPDCERYERQIDRMNARESELQQSKEEALTAYNLECKRNDELREENDKLKAELKKFKEADKSCPNCLSGDVIWFTSDLDLCQKCGQTF